jgi:hypothetical protein
MFRFRCENIGNSKTQKRTFCLEATKLLRKSFFFGNTAKRKEGGSQAENGDDFQRNSHLDHVLLKTQTN